MAEFWNPAGSYLILSVGTGYDPDLRSRFMSTYTAGTVHHHSPEQIADYFVYVTVPPAATPRMLAAEFARFLGLPVTARANITDIIESVCGVLTDCRTSLVL